MKISMIMKFLELGSYLHQEELSLAVMITMKNQVNRLSKSMVMSRQDHLCIQAYNVLIVTECLLKELLKDIFQYVSILLLNQKGQKRSLLKMAMKVVKLWNHHTMGNLLTQYNHYMETIINLDRRYHYNLILFMIICKALVLRKDKI